MSWNRPIAVAIALTGRPHCGDVPRRPPEPPPSFADTVEQLAAVEKVTSDVANGIAVRRRGRPAATS